MKLECNVKAVEKTSPEQEKIKKLTDELCSANCKDSKYNLRSQQILFEISQIKKSIKYENN